MAGFSLVELMLSLSLGLVFSGSILQGLIAEGQNGARLSRLMRERAAQQRTLELLKQDLAQATAVSATPDLEQHSCSLAGRRVVLHLRTGVGPITYSLGAPPSGIWRGQVLMRCGPSFGLDGLITGSSTPLNRVVLDGLAARSTQPPGCSALLPLAVSTPVDLASSSALGFTACLEAGTGLLALRLEQTFAQSGLRAEQRIRQMRLVQLPFSFPS